MDDLINIVIFSNFIVNLATLEMNKQTNHESTEILKQILEEVKKINDK